MTTKTYKKYVAFDYTEFETAEECIAYENKKEAESLLKAVKRVQEICSKSDCDVCPFLINNNEKCPFHGAPCNIFSNI